MHLHPGGWCLTKQQRVCNFYQLNLIRQEWAESCRIWTTCLNACVRAGSIFFTGGILKGRNSVPPGGRFGAQLKIINI